MKDADLKKQHDEIIQKLISVDRNDFQTKADLMRELIKVSRPLLENNLVSGLKISDLATYINSKLLEFGIRYPRNESFYNLFTDSEKRSSGYGSNIDSTNSRFEHEHNFVGDYHEKICECGDLLRLGKHYVVAQEPIEEKSIGTVELTINPDKPKQDKTPKRPYSNPVVDYLQRLAYLNEDYADLLHDQVKKYYKYETVAKAIDDYFKDENVAKMMIEVKSLEAKLIHADKNSDARQKVGEFEKIKAFVLQLTTHTVAHVAKLLSITPKHMTNSVIRNQPQYEKILKWFKSVYLICPHCKKQHEWVAYDWFNEMCERRELDMDMTQPIVHNNK